MGAGHVPGECDLKPLNAQEVNLLQHEHAMLKARVEELERECNELVDDCGQKGAVMRDIALAFEDGNSHKVNELIRDYWTGGNVPDERKEGV
jgi:hypothetical protein